MRPKHEPQKHFDVQSGCGCSLVGVGFQNVLVACVLGMSESWKFPNPESCHFGEKQMVSGHETDISEDLPAPPKNKDANVSRRTLSEGFGGRGETTFS